MTPCFSILHVDDGLRQTSLFSHDKAALRMLGRDHHRAAPIVPDLTLRGHYGALIAKMDEYVTDWVEHVPEPVT